MGAWWGRLLELVETVPILFSCLVLRCVEEEILKQKSNCECGAWLFTVFICTCCFMKRLLLCIRGKIW